MGGTGLNADHLELTSAVSKELAEAKRRNKAAAALLPGFKTSTDRKRLKADLDSKIKAVEMANLAERQAERGGAYEDLQKFFKPSELQKRVAAMSKHVEAGSQVAYDKSVRD
jgi:hypothetical protein